MLNNTCPTVNVMTEVNASLLLWIDDDDNHHFPIRAGFSSFLTVVYVAREPVEKNFPEPRVGNPSAQYYHYLAWLH